MTDELENNYLTDIEEFKMFASDDEENDEQAITAFYQFLDEHHIGDRKYE